MRRYPSTDLKQKLGDVLAVASREPVAITKHGKSRFVLMSLETYQTRFPDDPRRSHAIEEMPQEHLDLLEGALMDKDRR
ncbi:MAG TPA: type II toxin-antitoxin system Phd/YefM family antitoxin [Rhizobiaceae bacterium]